MKIEDLFKKEILIEVVEDSLRPNFKGHSEDIKLKEIFMEKLDELKGPLYDYFWELVTELTGFVDELDERGYPRLKEVGTKKVSYDLIHLVSQYVSQQAEAFLVEGYALKSGKCMTCDSKSCPVIKRFKPEQYDEKVSREWTRKPKVSVISLGMGIPKNIPDELKEHIIKMLKDLPFGIDEKMIREKLEAGTFSMDMKDIRGQGKSKTLSEILGADEEEIKKWIKDQVKKE